MLRTFNQILPVVTGTILVLQFFSSPALAVEATRGRIVKGDSIVDENGIFLENEYMRAGIVTNGYAGMVMSFIYKPTGQELAPDTPQGYCKDRMGENRVFWKTNAEGYKGRIVSTSEEKAVAEVEYVWNYDYNETKTKILITKTYTLEKASSVLQVNWKLKNTGDKTVMMTPWIKHVGGKDEQLLANPTRILLEQGPVDPKGAFVDAVTNWSARLSGEADTERLPMVCAITEFGKDIPVFRLARRTT